MRPALLVMLSLVVIAGATWIGGAALTAELRRTRARSVDPLRPRPAIGARVMEYALVIGFVALVISAWATVQPRPAAARDVGAAVDRMLSTAAHAVLPSTSTSSR
jgi:Flp pilus assembly pilin Flp